MEQTNITGEPQEQQSAELRPWVTPTFERVRLDKALFEINAGVDAHGHGS